MRRIGWAVLAVASLAAAAPAGAQDWTWRGRVAADKWLEIKGVNGSIRAVAATGNEIEIEAAKSARRSDPDDVKIEVLEHAGGVTICAIYPAPPNREANECRPGEGGRMNSQNNDVKVDFVVRVPRDTRFAGRTVNGAVTATGLGADVKAHTVNGSIRVSTNGLAEAGTVNGSIDVSMGRADWQDILEFETVNGAVVIQLPEQIDTQVHASTVNGSIMTDYPLTVRGRFGPKRMSGTIGKGGRELSLGTVNGDIEIRKR
ncbi:MAG TPA: DUF4097 family beta strand repeat-containing protein [Longimicrobiales bacterium]|nr:DUF4097 family beta strand repeat-containing protein [Longimicrobiales bacterium]